MIINNVCVNEIVNSPWIDGGEGAYCNDDELIPMWNQHHGEDSDYYYVWASEGEEMTCDEYFSEFVDICAWLGRYDSEYQFWYEVPADCDTGDDSQILPWTGWQIDDDMPF
jgi:hypothetical protein